MSKKIIFVVTLAVVCAVAGVRLTHKQARLQYKVNAAKSLEGLISAAEPVALTIDAKAKVSQLNKSYLTLRLANPKVAINADAVLEIGQGLRSENARVRETCANMGLTMLSDWVLMRDKDDWFKEPELVAFFRVFKKTNPPQLKRFFERMHPQQEQEFLNQI